MDGSENFGPEQLADVSALADGSIDPARAAEAEARIKDSPALSALYQRERRIVELLHRAAATHHAPAHLRAQLEAGRARQRPGAPRRLSFGAVAAAALLAVALLLVSLLPGGTPASPSVSQAAVLASWGATAPPPSPDARDRANRLDRQVGGLYFPNWETSVGWRAVGQRTDRVGRRQIVTVYYRWRGRDVAYTIVDAPALEQPGGRIARMGDNETRTLIVDGRTVVTWRRAGHTCILSATGVPADTLRGLAAWPAPPISGRAEARAGRPDRTVLSRPAGAHGAVGW